MRLEIPKLSLVVLIGASGSGKSTFAAAHFKPTEVVSSDTCRAIVSDDPNDQSATADAFALVHFIARTRLNRGLLTVIDATSVRKVDREPLIELARECHVPAVAIVFDLPERVCLERNATRPDRDFGPHVVRRQRRALKQGLGGIRREGFSQVYRLASEEEVEAAGIERVPLRVDKRDDHGPFDIIGDIHGCYDELMELLEKLGYQVGQDGVTARPPAERKAVFLGDYGDRGPNTPDVYRLVMAMVAAGDAYALPGNHDDKLKRYLQGRRVQITHGLDKTVEQLEPESGEFKAQLREFIDGLPTHYVFDGGALVVAHGGMPEELQGRASRTVRSTALYGVTTGEQDELGLPVRLDWGADYRGHAFVVYGHTPVAEPKWVNRTINIDTGCVFGGRLTALRYPEQELVSVPARQTYVESARPFLPEHLQGEAAPTAERPVDLLDINDVLGKRQIETRLQGRVSIREENATAALEVMSRFAVDPRWLIYLPPTMSPPNTSRLPGYLEYPAEAFDFYRDRGIEKLVCEEKHMGSRAVVILCRDPDEARRRFGVESGLPGMVYTRTGRRFFNDDELEREFLERLRAAATGAGFWERHDTGWVCLDCELMPWSLKALDLLRQQYAAVGASARVALSSAIPPLEQLAARGIDSGYLLDRQRERLPRAERFIDAYRHYAWPVHSISDLKLAPFHVMATEGGTHLNQDHLWHLGVIASICERDPDLLHATHHRQVELGDTSSEQAAIAWWEEIAARGSEGMVVKPLQFVPTGKRGLIQPAIKVRGREYLRIIYGPEYDLPEHLQRLRNRNPGRKRALALREFALGVEALERFVAAEPLYRVHECVFGVLALESEPVDPRL